MQFIKLALLVAFLASSSWTQEVEEILDLDQLLRNQTGREIKKQVRGRWAPDIEVYNPPAEMGKDLPAYVAGYDFTKRPVYVMEYGKWKADKYIDAGPEQNQLFDRYFEKLIWWTASLRSPFPDADDGVLCIIDMEGFGLWQLASANYLRHSARQALRATWVEENFTDIIFVNVNYAFHAILQLLRRVAPNIGGRMHVFGTRSETWKPKLLDMIPKDQLPPWYGGKQGFKPLQVFPPNLRI